MSICVYMPTSILQYAEQSATFQGVLGASLIAGRIRGQQFKGDLETFRLDAKYGTMVNVHCARWREGGVVRYGRGAWFKQ